MAWQWRSFSYQLSVISYQLSVYELSVISYRLSVISYQLSVSVIVNVIVHLPISINGATAGRED